MKEENVDLIIDNDIRHRMVKEPTKLEYYLNLIERISSINHRNEISLRTTELEEEINSIIKHRQF